MMQKSLTLLVLCLQAIVIRAQPALKYTIVSKAGYGFNQVIDTAGIVLVDSILAPKCVDYYSCRYNEGVFRFMRDGKYGYKDIHNHVLVPAQFDDVYDMVNGRGIVMVGDKMRLINRQGRSVFRSDFLYVSYADTTGLLIAVDAANRLLLLTTQGDTILEPTYKPFGEHPAFVQGRLAIINGSKIGFIDPTGTVVIDTTLEADAGMYQEADWYEQHEQRLNAEGYMHVQDEMHVRSRRYPVHDYYRFDGGRSLARKNGQNVVIDMHGRIVYAIPPDRARLMNKNGLIQYTIGAWKKGRFRIRHGLYDRNGKEIVRNMWNPDARFGDGLMRIGFQRDRDYFIDTSGRRAFRGRRFRSVGDFTDGCASLELKKKGETVCRQLTLRGELLTCDSISLEQRADPESGWHRIRTQSGVGYADSTGRVMIPPIYQRLSGFSQGYCGFQEQKPGWNGRSGYINMHNEIVIPARFESVWDFQVLKPE